MSYQLPRAQIQPELDGSDYEEVDDSDDGCSDWASSFGEARRTTSLFDHSVHDSPESALRHDAAKHGVQFNQLCEEWKLDSYGKIRLVNLIRRDKLTPDQVRALDKDGKWRSEDSLMVPVIPDDPMLQFGIDDSWSDDEPESGPSKSANGASRAIDSEVARLRAELAATRALLQDTLDDAPVSGKAKVRDDDTHYFDSYAENDIHEIMLKDTTRTVSYARFILSNPSVFKGATVMDVGCGTGILSMFAARAGAKKVYAVEASGLAAKARENICNNGLESVINVIQGKVETIDIEDKVDVIISEWMGYMLLYESMLDSVLHARDRFLRDGGLMAPSQTRLLISGITGERLWKERMEFWSSVYGFDMTAMNGVYFDEGLVEVVDAAEIATNEAVVRDIDTHTATPRSLDFHSSFTLTVQASGKIRAFLTYFDTFFSPTPTTVQNEVDTTLIGDALDPVEAAEPGLVSFTTGPRGKPTHWRQVAFLLQKCIETKEGDEIRGRFYCRKSSNNSRELDVEIHYAVGEGATTVQAFKVR